MTLSLCGVSSDSRPQISDVAWAPMSLRIPLGIVSLRARNASVVSVAATSMKNTYALTTLVLDDNALASLQQARSVDFALSLTATLQVFSCQRCGLQLGVELIIQLASYSLVNSLREVHLAQVRPTADRNARSDRRGTAQ